MISCITQVRRVCARLHGRRVIYFWLVGAVVVLAVLYSVGPQAGVKLLADTNGLDARLNEMEAKHSREINELSRQIAALSSGTFNSYYSGRILTDEQVQSRMEQREHFRRMREDEGYALEQEQKRLASLERDFAMESVDHSWASKMHAHVDETLQAAVLASGAKVKGGKVDCRSSQCRIVVNLDPGSSYEDLLLHLMADNAEVLPHAKVVVLMGEGGARTVNIYSSRGSSTASSRIRGDEI
jgi:hypothetical protein